METLVTSKKCTILYFCDGTVDVYSDGRFFMEPDDGKTTMTLRPIDLQHIIDVYYAMIDNDVNVDNPVNVVTDESEYDL